MSVGESILVVEDDEDIRTVLRLVLESRGYAVREASHGAEALERFRTEATPDLVLLDLRMPVMDGRELAATLRSTPAWSDVPIVVLSGDPLAHSGVIGACDVLAKPVEVPQLFSSIRRALERHG